MKTRDDGQAGSRSRGLLAVATIVLVSIVTLGILEVSVRVLLPYNTPDTVRQYSLEYEPAVYTRSLLKPVGRLVELDSGKAWGGKATDEASEVAVFISSNGYRGPAFAVQKPPETTRIIVLGGSAVFDHGVRDGDTDEGSWPHLLGKRLTESGVDNIEVINAGIPGHATADSLGRLFTQLWMYSPDFVLVYHGWNDIKYWKSLEISPDRPLISQFSPYDPESNPFISYRGFWDRLLSNSQIYMKIRNKYFMSKVNVGAEGALTATGERAIDYEAYGPEQFRLNLELIVSACEVIGAEPVLVTQATLLSPDSSSADRERINYDYQSLEHDTLIRAYDETYQITRDIGARTGAMIIDAAPDLNGVSEYFGDHVHFSPAGSAALADRVAKELAPVLVADRSSVAD